jgi:hypothetical protein
MMRVDVVGCGWSSRMHENEGVVGCGWMQKDAGGVVGCRRMRES